MKKYLIIIWAAVFAAGLAGCSKKETNVEKSATLDVTVLHKDWVFDENAMQFYYHCDVPEITNHIYDYGNWTLSREYFKGTKDAYQVALPMSCFMTDTARSGVVTYYTQYIDYRVGVGYIELQLTNSDYLYTYVAGKPVAPDDMYFRLQLIY